jgi:signal transduction histidine kinase
VTSRALPSLTQNSQSAAASPQKGARSALEQLLHALNQPLTGLQCSMEVALASPRTAEQYASGLREGLKLTGRMRALVEAIREVVDLEAETSEPAETIELKALLQEVVDNLAPVAETNRVRMVFDCSTAVSKEIRAARPALAAAAFRLLESSLSLTTRGSELKIEVCDTPVGARISLQWTAGKPPGVFSPPELGLLIAQSGWERAGAQWERERKETLETVTIRLPAFSGSAKF